MTDLGQAMDMIWHFPHLVHITAAPRVMVTNHPTMLLTRLSRRHSQGTTPVPPNYLP
jgi:hypothetical protein